MSEAESEALILTRRQLMARGAAVSATVAGMGALQFAPAATAASIKASPAATPPAGARPRKTAGASDCTSP